MATLKPKSIQDVLADSTAANNPTTTTITTSPTKNINQAQLEANKAKATEREQTKVASPTISANITPEVTPEIDLGGGPAYVTSSMPGQVFASKSAMDEAVRTGVVAPGSTLKNPNAPVKTTGTSGLDTLGDINNNKKSVVKTNVGKYVSDFKGALTDNKDDFYNTINYAGLDEVGKKTADRMFDSYSKTTKKREEEKMKDPTYAYTKMLTDTQKEIIEQNKTDTKAALEAKKESKAKLDTFVSEENATEDNAFNTFETTQNDLLKNYEGNRLNQVQGNLRRALLNRGVDVSKIPQEQLIALSGEIGAQAFSDISSAKERAVNAIETARQNKIAKIRQLKAQKVLSDQQYEESIADINSKAAALDTNTKLKFAETVFGLQTTKVAQDKTEKQNAVQNALSTAQALGVKGSQFGVVSNYLNKATSADAINTMISSLNDPASPLYTILKSNEDAATKAAQFKNELDLMEAKAKLMAASRSGGSGKTTPEPVVNPNAK